MAEPELPDIDEPAGWAEILASLAPVEPLVLPPAAPVPLAPPELPRLLLELPTCPDWLDWLGWPLIPDCVPPPESEDPAGWALDPDVLPGFWTPLEPI